MWSRRNSLDDFPLKNPFQDSTDFDDAFVFKLGAAGDSLIFSTYLGGSEHDYPLKVAVDESYHTYVLGVSHSPDFPVTSGVLDTSYGTADNYVTKFTPGGDSLVFSSYFFDDATLMDFDIDTGHHVYVVGWGRDSLPVVNAYQPTFGGGIGDAYLAKVGPDFDSLLYSTYLGVIHEEVGRVVAVDSDGRVFVAGTGTASFPQIYPSEYAFGPPAREAQNDKLFVALFNADASCPIFSTPMATNVRKIDYQVYGDIIGPGEYVIGFTSTYGTFPLVDPYSTYVSAADNLIAKVAHPLCTVEWTGDVNLSCNITSADIIGLVNYVFKSGAEPSPCPAAGDVNCDAVVTSADIIYEVNFVFKSGDWPCNVCELVPGSWSCP